MYGTDVPPMIYINEADPRQVEEINMRIRRVTEASSAEALAAAIQDNGMDYLYLGDRVEQPWGRFLLDARYFECMHSVGEIKVYRLR